MDNRYGSTYRIAVCMTTSQRPRLVEQLITNGTSHKISDVCKVGLKCDSKLWERSAKGGDILGSSEAYLRIALRLQGNCGTWSCHRWGCLSTIRSVTSYARFSSASYELVRYYLGRHHVSSWVCDPEDKDVWVGFRFGFRFNGGQARYLAKSPLQDRESGIVGDGAIVPPTRQKKPLARKGGKICLRWMDEFEVRPKPRDHPLRLHARVRLQYLASRLLTNPLVSGIAIVLEK